MNNEFKSVTDRFLRYVKVDTQSDEASETFPSTEKQKDLARLLLEELKDLGIKAEMDEENCYVYGWIESTIPNENDKRNKYTLAFASHMDTSPAASGTIVNPQIVENYQGQVIDLGNGLKLDPKEFTSLNMFIGQDLITTDGKTLLGADDKAGVAEIMTMATYLVNNPQVEHGPIAICFTPDEEIGAGVARIDLERLGADFAYTVDGGELGELQYENFNAASAKIQIRGKSVHPGSAKGLMVNAADIAVEFADSLPKDQVPQKTEGYEGFFSLQGISGDVSNASLSYIIRDHDMDKFVEKKNLMAKITEELNEKYGQGTVSLELKDSYFNMKEKIKDHMFLIEKAKEAMENLDIEPLIAPIRGGTDGAQLSYMGLPTPNICAGGINFHGEYEYVSIQSMEKISELLVEIAVNIFK
ncbi:peptidase T [Helcococcus massiliensis]|uniref:peptidase T n=1 Tax=Helcococcus massiliensis TaxID=2040290 RepID=UPI000CDE88F9|nr:peptidase T [Helcococcus massiliensis]